MSKRRTQDSDYLFGSEDDPIGLTSAFAPVKGPQSVEYDKNDDAIGLTQAFEPIPDQDEPRAWDEAGKWKDFDWNAAYNTGSIDAVDSAGGAAPRDDHPAQKPSSTGSQPAVSGAAAGASAGSGGSKRGRHAAPDASMSPRMEKSRKTRRRLIVLVVLLILALAALGFFGFRMFSASQQEAENQAQEEVEGAKDSLGSAASDGAGATSVKQTEVPDLVSVLGMTSDEAVEALGHGALITANREVNEEGSAIKTNLNVALTEEPVDTKTGSPTVYLGLDKDGKVVQVGYSASAAALGFGSLSFTDAVNNEHVIEKTLYKAGVNVPEGSAVLPTDKSEYSTYGEDGTTVVRERCSFEGDTTVGGKDCSWSSVLSYDYTTQVLTGDLSDTVRIIYVYITQK